MVTSGLHDNESSLERFLFATVTKSENHGDDFGSVLTFTFTNSMPRSTTLKRRQATTSSFAASFCSQPPPVFAAGGGMSLARCWQAGGRGGDVQQQQQQHTVRTYGVCCLKKLRRGRMVNACGQSTTNNNERGRAEGTSISFFPPSVAYFSFF